MEGYPTSGMEYYEYPDYIDIMELYVETLTGTIFELHVSPFETVISVKAKIQRVEGIPIGQQHLIYRSMELEDDYCLQDYGIPPGASLKLVLAMRGGPINTRRIPMEDPAIREMADYMEANKDEIWEKLPGNRQVTLLVFREGDQLNFFRVVDRGDGTLTPLSESLSPAGSAREYEEEAVATDNSKHLTVEQSMENDAVMNKMKLLRTKMDNLSLSKKQSKIPRPPSRPRSSARRRIPSARGAKAGKNSITKVEPLPPVGRGVDHRPLASLPAPHPPVVPRRPPGCLRSMGRSEIKNEIVPSSNPEHLLMPALTEQRELSTENKTTILPTPPPNRRAETKKGFARPPVLSGSRGTPTLNVGPASRRAHPVDHSSPVPNALAQRNLENLSAKFHRNRHSPFGATSLPKFAQGGGGGAEEVRPGAMSSQRVSSSLQFSNPGGSPVSADRLSLGTADARVVTELVNQANREGKISNIVRQRDPLTGGNRARISPSPAILNRVFNGGSATISTSRERMTTPEARNALISAHSIRGRLSGGRDSRIVVSPVYRLPPVVNSSVTAKKKSSKRCYLCNKKTGLATSYQCRCGHNYCASHRYAETHSCGFDYKGEGRKLLERSNPLVSAPKLPKI